MKRLATAAIVLTLSICSFVTAAPTGLVGDINADYYVNVSDLQLLVAAWASGPNVTGPEDINSDGYVNVGDLQLLVAHWGESSSLPSPWQRVDIGAVGATGTASYSAPTFTIEGSGADIWGTADEFCFVYQSLNGNGSIVARVASVENTNVWAKAGVMIRESLAAGSKHAMMVATPAANGTSFQWRTAADGVTDYVNYGSVGLPRYVKVQRVGNNISGYESSDGSVWNQMGSTQTISMATNVYAGLCVTSHADGTLCTGTLTNVSVTSGGNDTTAPAAVSNLATSNPTTSSITLTWTAPGDDGSIGTATSYDIRYRTSGAVDNSNWASATQVTGEPAPATAGTNQNMVVGGLAAGTTYYFAIKTLDDVPNASAISNSPGGTTGMDTIAPAAVSNLAAGNPTASSITLTWTAPGDDGATGTATSYDIRYRTGEPVDDSNWASATQVSGEPTPAAAGTIQSKVVTGLMADTTYYFAIKTFDEAPNASGISNSPQGRTIPADTMAPGLVMSLATSDATYNSITLTWTAPGDDANTGTAASYDIRYRTGGPVDDSNWASATQVTNEPTPATAGTSQNMTVSFLLPGLTYYFAIKTSDEAANVSAISNSPEGTTLPYTPNSKPVLGPRDFKYKGYYKILKHSGGLSEIEWGQGFTHRYVNGQLRFLTLSYFPMPEYVQKLVEFAPPASLGGTVTARTNLWADIWAGMDSSYCGWTGLWYEQATGRLWTTSAADYPNATQIPYTRAIAYRTLNSDGTISNPGGPWGLAGVQQRRIYGGVIGLPQWFQNAYGVGPYATGWGGYASMINVGPCVLGPTFYTFPEPTGYPIGDSGIPASAFKELMNHNAPVGIGGDWYANTFPTSYDRGVRNSDVINEYDYGNWSSPAPDGIGRWTWGDSNWNTGCWIETPNKQGFILVPQLCNGRAWYETSTLHCQRQSAEIQVFDPRMLGEVALGTRANWNTYPTHRWQITDDLLPLGFGPGQADHGPRGGPAGASYDSTTQTLYVYCIWGTDADSYILLYDVDLQQAAVHDVAASETAVNGTVSGKAANTETADGIYQTVQEVVQGNTSQLERKWTFNVTAGSSITFRIKAYKTGNSEGDDFAFAYSTNGTNWTKMVTVGRTTDDGTFQTYTMPGGTSGTVYVRVQDADRTAGNNNLDTIYIDRMFFLSNP